MAFWAMSLAHKVVKRQRGLDGYFRDFALCLEFASFEEADRVARMFVDEQRALGVRDAYIDVRSRISSSENTLRYSQCSYACDRQEARESTARAIPVAPSAELIRAVRSRP